MSTPGGKSTPKLTLEGLIREAYGARLRASRLNTLTGNLASVVWKIVQEWLESKRPAELVALPAELETALREWRENYLGRRVVASDAKLIAAINKCLPKEGA